MTARRIRAKNQPETEQSAVIAAAMLLECVAVVIGGRYLARRGRPARQAPSPAPGGAAV